MYDSYADVHQKCTTKWFLQESVFYLAFPSFTLRFFFAYVFLVLILFIILCFFFRFLIFFLYFFVYYHQHMSDYY